MKGPLRLFPLILCAFLVSFFASPEAEAFAWKTAPGDFFGPGENRLESSPASPHQHWEKPPLPPRTASGVHKYLYADANPVNNVDPSGYFSIGKATNVAVQAIMFTARTVTPNVVRQHASRKALQTSTGVTVGTMATIAGVGTAAGECGRRIVVDESPEIRFSKEANSN